MKHTFVLWLFSLYSCVMSQNNVITPNKSQADDAVGDTEFDVPSVTAQYIMPTMVVNLEAYSTRNRDSDRLQWLSIGYPMITEINDQKLQYTSSEIVLYVQLLESSQKEALVQQARLLFPNNIVTKNDINLLPLEYFTCRVGFALDSTYHQMQGKSMGLLSNVVPIRFPYSKTHPKRMALVEYLSRNPIDSLIFECDLAAAGKKVRQNSLVIKGLKTNAEDLVGKLVGPAGEGYVTRDQMTSFAQAISTMFNIEQEYEIDNERFSDAFIEKVLGSATEAFKELSFDKVINRLSTYGVSDGAAALEPDVIKHQLSDVFTVRNESGMQLLVAKTGNTTSGSTDTKVGGSHSASGGIPKVAEAKLSVDWSVGHQQEWEKNNTALDDQLKQMNKNSGDNVQFEWNGTKVIPKSLKVAIVKETQLTQTFTFQRIKKRISQAQYFKTYELSFFDNKHLPTGWKEFTQENRAAQTTLEDERFKIFIQDHDVIKLAESLAQKYTEEIKKLKTNSDQTPADSALQKAIKALDLAAQEIKPSRTWTRIPGYAKHISCKQSNLWAMNHNHQVMYYNSSSSEWKSISQAALFPAATSKPAAWYLTKKDQEIGVRNYNIDSGTSSEANFDCMQINAITPVKAVCSTKDGRIFKYNYFEGGYKGRGAKGTWEQLTDFRAYEVAIGEGSEIWAIDFKTELHRYYNGNWMPMNRKAKHVDVQSADFVVITGFDDMAYVLTDEGGWNQLPGQECQQATIDFHHVYCLSPSGAIFKTSLNENEEI